MLGNPRWLEEASFVGRPCLGSATGLDGAQELVPVCAAEPHEGPCNQLIRVLLPRRLNGAYARVIIGGDAMPPRYRIRIGSRERAAIIALVDYVRDELHVPGGAPVTRKRNRTVDHRSWRGRRLLSHLSYLRPLVTKLKQPAKRPDAIHAPTGT